MAKKARIFQVYQSVGGYDVVMLVKATTKRRARDVATKAFPIEREVKLVTNKMLADDEFMRAEFEILSKKRVGDWRVTSEGT